MFSSNCADYKKLRFTEEQTKGLLSMMVNLHYLVTLKIQKFKETGDSRYIHQNKLDKSCFQHNVEYGDCKDLPRRTVADRVLRDKAFSIAKKPKYDGYQRGLGLMIYKCFN